MLDSSRLPLPHPPSAQGTVATPSRLGRGLAIEPAVASVATLGATADSESSAQSAAATSCSGSTSSFATEGHCCAF